MTVHLVANPASRAGRGTKQAGDITRMLAGRSRGAPIEAHVPDSVEAARLLLAELAADGDVARVVVAGGDGMVHLAVNALVGTDTVLGIVRTGTGNDAATGLRLPRRLDAACATAMAPARPVDLLHRADESDESGSGESRESGSSDEPGGESGEAGGARGGRYAITVAIVGLAVAINERAETMRFPKGRAKYSVATLAELPRLEVHDLAVTIDGVEHTVTTNLLAIANLSCFGGGMAIAPEADPADGQLELISVGPANPALLGALLPTIFTGRHVRNRHVTVLRGSSISVSRNGAPRANGGAGVGQGADGGLRLRADGEPWGRLPATITCAPAAISIAGARVPPRTG